MQPLKAGLLYGILGFATGFVFGALRELALIPLLGDRGGHLLEFPLLIAVIIFIAARIVKQFALSAGSTAFACGLIGVAVLLVIESIFALGIMGQDLDSYLASFNVMKGELFPFGLVIMALAPVFFSLRQSS